MTNYNTLPRNKVYSMLFVADYTNATPSWRQYVDTLINNLLDKPPSAEWVKYEHLPKITVSIIDKAETRQQAFDKLSTVKYDVVFVDTMLNGQPNGAAIIGRFRQFQDTSMYIPLIAPTQIKGAVKKDGTICDGAGIERLYARGFYNGVSKKDLNLGKLIEMILAGGRSKEDAFIAYGLDYGQAKLEEDIHTSFDAGKVEEAVSPDNASVPAADGMEFLLKVAELFPEFSLNQVKSFVKKADSNFEKLQIVSSLFHTKTGLVDPYGWVMNTLADDEQAISSPSDQDVAVDIVNGKEFIDVENVKQTSPLPVSAVDNASNVTSAGGEVKPLNRKQRRELRRQQKLEAEEIQKTSSITSSDTEEINTAVVQSDTVAPTQVPNDPYMRELEQLQTSGALQERGTFNNGLVRAGVIHGNIIFAKGTMAIVELAVDMETLGLRLPDIYNAPVVIPYSKFGMGDIKKD